MTTTALHTGFATEIDGARVLVVGYLHSHPAHPARGAAVWDFAEADTAVMATGVIGGPLYALVSVRWATPVTTIEPDGTQITRHVEGLPFCPKGTTWYLHPVDIDPETGAYVLDPARPYAASGPAPPPCPPRLARSSTTGASAAGAAPPPRSRSTTSRCRRHRPRLARASPPGGGARADPITLTTKPHPRKARPC